MSYEPVCRACGSKALTAKYEAKYVYSYAIDSDAPGRMNHMEMLPFQFDQRDQVEARQFIQCNVCGIQYPCYFSQDSSGIDLSTVQQALQ